MREGKKKPGSVCECNRRMEEQRMGEERNSGRRKEARLGEKKYTHTTCLGI